MKSISRVALFGLVALVVIGALFASKAGDLASSNLHPAASSKKATLIIDFGAKSRRPIAIYNLDHLAENASGWDVLKLAGVKVQGTDQFPDGFACRINSWPVDQDCRDTPTAKKGHWAYFISNAKLAKGWLLSGQGAATHIPDCGGFEGWSWVPAGSPVAPPRHEISALGCNK